MEDGALTVVANFIKAHWQALALVVLIGVGYGWFRHEQSGWATTVANLNAAHQADIDAINKARADEEAQHQQELQALQASLAQAQQQYAAAQAALAAQTTAEQNQIIHQYGNNTAGLANVLASKYGFVVVTPAP